MVRELFLAWRGAADDAAVDAAASVAAALGAHLSVAVVVELPLPLHKDGVLFQVHLWTGLYDELRAAIDPHVARLRDRLSARGIGFDVRRADALYHIGPDVAAVQARYADLALLGAGCRTHADRQQLEAWFHALLTGAGRPVLLLAGGQPALPARRVVVGWRPTPQASRAVHEMRALIAPDAEIDVVVVDADADAFDEGPEPGADMAAHLARHGARVRVVRAEAGSSVAEALARHAELVDAQLLVCGGYGHGRLRERLFGGVTRDLLFRARVPVLFAQ